MIKRDRMRIVAEKYFNTFVDVCFNSYIEYGEDKSVVVLKHFMEDYHINTLRCEQGATPVQDLTLGEFFCSNYQVSEKEVKTFEELFFNYFASAMAYEITKMVQQLIIETFETEIEFKEVDKIITAIDISHFTQEYQNKFSDIMTIITNHNLIDRKVSDFIHVKKNEDN